MVCHSLLQLTTFCQTSPPWPTHLGWPHMAWLNFIELDKAVVCVIRLASFLWVWFQCICPLMPSYNTYHPTWVSLTWTWGISSQLLQQSAAAALTFDEGCLLRSTPPDLERGIAPLSPPALAQPLLLGRGVVPLGHRPWPRAWGGSSRPRFCKALTVQWIGFHSSTAWGMGSIPGQGTKILQAAWPRPKK